MQKSLFRRFNLFVEIIGVLNILLCWQTNLIYAQNSSVEDPDPLRYEDTIKTFITWDHKNSFPKHAILFIGSSSIRLWYTSDAFPNYPLINRGFGGSHISDVLHYYDQIVKKYQPQLILFYAGDNDIAAGKKSDRVYNDFLKFYKKVHEDLPGANVVFLSIKPSLARWNYWGEMQKVNSLIEEYARRNMNLFYADVATALLGADRLPDKDLFISDGLHLNPKGYARWQSVVAPMLRKLYSWSDNK